MGSNNATLVEDRGTSVTTLLGADSNNATLVEDRGTSAATLLGADSNSTTLGRTAARDIPRS